MVLRTYLPDSRHTRIIETLSAQDLYTEDYIVMCLDANKLIDLCDLYPATAESLKYRGLDRRQFFINEMEAQEKIYSLASMKR